jgi:hypothetical protein
MTQALAFILAAWVAVAGQAPAQTREQKVLADRARAQADGFWIYNDLPAGVAQAKKTGKPLLVVLRCIPCEECVKLDDELVNKDERVRPLLEKFVRVRLVATNGLDLSLFQFDYDQSFAAFMMNADETIYGRYGTRSHRTYWSDDVSIEGLAQALQGALELHAQYPANKEKLAGKTGPAPQFPSPEKYPQFRERFGPKLNYESKVVQSCIHCHQVGEAQREFQRQQQGTIAEATLFSYPHPKSLGLILDPRQKAAVQRVVDRSPAHDAGFAVGDKILEFGGQPPLSIADIQWVLHQTPAEGGTVTALIQRGQGTVQLNLRLPAGWRRSDDISWRASTWSLRRMVLGGMRLEPLSAQDRQKPGLPEHGLAINAKYVPQGGGPYGAAKRAGFKEGDVIVAFDNRTDLQRETDLIAEAIRNHKVGDQVEVKVQRDGAMVTLTLPMQD